MKSGLFMKLHLPSIRYSYSSCRSKPTLDNRQTYLDPETQYFSVQWYTDPNDLNFEAIQIYICTEFSSAPEGACRTAKVGLA
jgi:hypothetical protein